MEIKIYNTLPPEAKTVRETVFIDEQGFSYDYDEVDDVAVHFVMFENKLPVAACRVFQFESPKIFALGRLAVKKECRGKNYGSMMLDAAKEYVRSIGGEALILHSQLHAKDFYAKNGFKEYGEIECEEDCPHIWMKFQI
ncbi:MAG: GNAT family N-acetyltransferase [Clostridia bacterium]|nr:GNAT family N-acetyltransferase [Clostridia bacterium]